METFEISGHTGRSMLLIGETLQNMVKYVPVPNAVIITDHNVWNAYHSEFPPLKVIKIGTGESIKTLDTAEYIYGELLTMEADRSSFIVGIGGGIVCDIAGFVASTYMRGIRFGFVATTLLSQVDASVGGKNGVNLKGYKNIVGVFNQPEFVICDTALLKTLPKKKSVAVSVRLLNMPHSAMRIFLPTLKIIMIRRFASTPKLLKDSFAIPSFLNPPSSIRMKPKRDMHLRESPILRMGRQYAPVWWLPQGYLRNGGSCQKKM